MIALRLHFARVEASRHSPQESRRHLVAAGHLLQQFPNIWLSGRVHLGLSIVDTLTGNWDGAIEQAQLAIGCAAQSGHSRTELAGLVNLSHALQCVDRGAAARNAIDQVLSKSADDLEITVSALDSLANLLIRENRLDVALETVREVDRLLATMPAPLHSRWAQSTVSQTKVRLLQASGSWSEADSQLLTAVANSIEQRDSYWLTQFSLLRIKGLVAVGKFDEAGDLVAKIDIEPANVDSLIERNRILGYAAMATAREKIGRE